MALVHDLAWNDNVYEATPYAICHIVHDLGNINTPDPGLLLRLLRRLGNAEGAIPEYIQWRGHGAQLITLCRQLVEAHLDLYARFLDDPTARSGALDAMRESRIFGNGIRSQGHLASKLYPRAIVKKSWRGAATWPRPLPIGALAPHYRHEEITF